MTKAEEYDKAWRMGFNGDFSLVDKIYHADYSAYDYRAGLEVNIEWIRLLSPIWVKMWLKAKCV